MWKFSDLEKNDTEFLKKIDNKEVTGDTIPNDGPEFTLDYVKETMENCRSGFAKHSALFKVLK